MAILIGIDPGINGAIAVLDNSNRIFVTDIPTIGREKKEIVIPRLWEIINQETDAVVYIEKAQSMPKQSCVATFNYGVAYGIIQGLIVAKGFPMQFVRPMSWKRVMLADMSKSDKNASRKRAIQLWPLDSKYFGRSKDEHRAEAALIAEYGRRLEAGTGKSGM